MHETLLWLQDFLQAWLASLQTMFVAANKRVSFGYLASATVVALVWFYWHKGWSWQYTLRQCFSRHIWWSVSARLDYKLTLLNQGIMLLLRPVLIGKLAVAAAIYYAMADWFIPLAWQWSGLNWIVPLAYTVVLFVLDDASRYYVHRLMHLWPVLWAFHRLHHSAETLTPFTVLRTHPVEGVLFSLRGALIQGVVTGIFVYWFGNKVSLWDVLGANTLVFLFNALGANLRHSHLPLNYGSRVEAWLLSPAQHQLHHSVDTRHYDKNFGVILACWDRLGGTWMAYNEDKPLRFGVTDEHGQHSTIKQAYLQPFYQAFMHIINKPLGKNFLFSRGKHG